MSHPVQCHQKDRDDCVLYLIAPLPLPLSPHLGKSVRTNRRQTDKPQTYMFLHTVLEGSEFFRTHPPSCILISCENAIAIRFGLADQQLDE